MRKNLPWPLLILLGAALSPAQTKVDLITQGKRVDFSAASTTKPVKTGTSIPLSCTAGELFYKTDATSGANIYGCVSGFFVAQAGGGTLPWFLAGDTLYFNGSAATRLPKPADGNWCINYALSVPSYVTCPGANNVQLGGDIGGTNASPVINFIGGKIIFLGASFQTFGSPLILRTTSATDVTLPTTGTLAVTASPTFTGTTTVANATCTGTCTGFGGTGSPGTDITVASSATPTFTCTSTTKNRFLFTLTANVTSSTLASCVAGATLVFQFNQDATGGRTFVPPTALTASYQPLSLTALDTTTEIFDMGASVADLSAPAKSLLGPPIAPTGAAPGGTPAANTLFPYFGTDNLPHTKDSTAATHPNAHDGVVPWSCTAASASGSAYTCATVPAFTPVAKDTINFCPDVANTGAATLNVNASIAAPLQKQQGQAALSANDLRASPACALLTFDGTNWQMQGQAGNAAVVGGSKTFPLTCVVGRDANGTYIMSGGNGLNSPVANNAMIGDTPSMGLDNSGAQFVVCRQRLATSFTSLTNAMISMTQSSGAAGNLVMALQVACAANGTSIASLSYSTAQVVTLGLPSANFRTDFVVTTPTQAGCAGGQDVYMKWLRQAGGSTGVLNYSLISVEEVF